MAAGPVCETAGPTARTPPGREPAGRSESPGGVRLRGGEDGGGGRWWWPVVASGGQWYRRYPPGSSAVLAVPQRTIAHVRSQFRRRLPRPAALIRQPQPSCPRATSLTQAQAPRSRLPVTWPGPAKLLALEQLQPDVSLGSKRQRQDASIHPPRHGPSCPMCMPPQPAQNPPQMPSLPHLDARPTELPWATFPARANQALVSLPPSP
ncbi:hypothetical protein BS50DRAFT_148647 [Corynespora cassiicola Philippines]|uniref:Uncharacterized protein n=1 Tax=Corynespora cassiicola Philippines TaxID=1448308 RepID=A0A2T2N7F2_CORCC|nr:hypothetical protein BS50DRAFT_148647 [Corynespora cassiicola Philippines]